MPRAIKTPRKTARPKPAPVETIKPLPLVWTEAMRLANGNAARIEVVSATEVLVRN